MTDERLKEILEEHSKWVLSGRQEGCCANLRDVDLRGADLSGADLTDADLSSTNLYDANLSGTDLSDANLSSTNLYDAKLIGADLRDANLWSANLRGANLYNADLRDANLWSANLRDADLWSANLSDADLNGADLSGADFTDADLSRADLRGADLNQFIQMTCPEKGSFIGFKKANNYIVELEILEDARRCSSTGRKCRCDKAKVLSITNIDGSECVIDEVQSDYSDNFIYKVGEVVEEPNFNEDRWIECSAGIHFFINRQEAVGY